jgi:hypothetical protein
MYSEGDGREPQVCFFFSTNEVFRYLFELLLRQDGITTTTSTSTHVPPPQKDDDDDHQTGRRR